MATGIRFVRTRALNNVVIYILVFVSVFLWVLLLKTTELFFDHWELFISTVRGFWKSSHFYQKSTMDF